MPEFLQECDVWLFYLINHGTSNPVFDLVMPFISEVRYFYIPYALLFLVLLWKGGAAGRWCALALAATVAITDPLNSRVIKEAVARVRPCRTLPDVRTLAPCGEGKSFPSSHAANNLAAAVGIVFYFRRWWWVAFGCAVAVAFSRVYLGVHYPADVIGGGVEGALIALLVVWLIEQLRSYLRRRKTKKAAEDSSSTALSSDA